MSTNRIIISTTCNSSNSSSSTTSTDNSRTSSSSTTTSSSSSNSAITSSSTSGSSNMKWDQHHPPVNTESIHHLMAGLTNTRLCSASPWRQQRFYACLSFSLSNPNSERTKLSTLLDKLKHRRGNRVIKRLHRSRYFLLAAPHWLKCHHGMFMRAPWNEFQNMFFILISFRAFHGYVTYHSSR